MKMGGLRSAGIAAVCNKIAFFYRENIRRDININTPRFQFILPTLHVSFQLRIEVIKVRVEGSIAIGMIDIDGTTETAWFYLYFRDISCCCRHHRQVFAFIGPDIQPHMVMIGTELSKIATQTHGNSNRVPEISFRIGSGWWLSPNGNLDKNDQYGQDTMHALFFLKRSQK